MDNTTIITALYNIQRDTKGDGRKWEDYLQWFEETLQLPLPMVLFIPKSLEEFVVSHRKSCYKTHIIIQELEEIPYAYLEPKMNSLLLDPIYQHKIRDPTRVECKLAYYNIIQYSKFKWLEIATNINPFQTNYFFWMDAGISRFIPKELYHRVTPRLSIPEKKLLIQNNDIYYHYPVDERYLWDSQCLLCGTMFGGDAYVIKELASILDSELCRRLDQCWINNEQILLAYLQKNKCPSMFHLVHNRSGKHLCLFEWFFI